MDFRKDSVMVTVRFVGGVFDETAETAGYTMGGALALSPGTAATRRLSASQISDLMTGKKVGYGGGPSEGGLGFQLAGSPEDLEDGLRLMHVLLTEPKIDRRAVT